MAIKITQTGVVMPDGKTQTTKMDSSTDRGKLIAVDNWTSSGTWTKRADVHKIHVIVVGGGGGGVGHCESGGAGGYAEKLIDVSALAVGATISVTIGNGGGGVGYNGTGGNGETTSFGSYVSASGGYGANRNWGHTGGHGGIGHGEIAGGGRCGCWGGVGRACHEHCGQKRAKTGADVLGGAVHFTSPSPGRPSSKSLTGRRFGSAESNSSAPSTHTFSGRA